MKRTRPRVDINLTELNQMLDHAVEAPLSQADCQKLKSTLQTLVELVKTYRNTEKTTSLAQSVSRFRMQRCIPAMPVPVAREERSISRKSRSRW